MAKARWKDIKGIKGQYIHINRDIDDFNDKRQDAYLRAMEENAKKPKVKKRKKKRPQVVST